MYFAFVRCLQAALRKAFTEADCEVPSGTVSVAQWAAALGKTLGLDLPWINLQVLEAAHPWRVESDQTLAWSISWAVDRPYRGIAL